MNVGRKEERNKEGRTDGRKAAITEEGRKGTRILWRLGRKAERKGGSKNGNDNRNFEETE
jgi:hypothetical protein